MQRIQIRLALVVEEEDREIELRHSYLTEAHVSPDTTADDLRRLLVADFLVGDGGDINLSDVRLSFPGTYEPVYMPGYGMPARRLGAPSFRAVLEKSGGPSFWSSVLTIEIRRPDAMRVQKAEQRLYRREQKAINAQAERAAMAAEAAAERRAHEEPPQPSALVGPDPIMPQQRTYSSTKRPARTDDDIAGPPLSQRARLRYLASIETARREREAAAQ